MYVEESNADSMDISTSKHSLIKITYRYVTSGKSFDVPIATDRFCSRIYFTDMYKCYALSDVVKLETCSFCGIMIKCDEKVPFLWRIDLKTGNREPVAWLDKGKVTCATRKTKIK